MNGRGCGTLKEYQPLRKRLWDGISRSDSERWAQSQIATSRSLRIGSCARRRARKEILTEGEKSVGEGGIRTHSRD